MFQGIKPGNLNPENENLKAMLYEKAWFNNTNNNPGTSDQKCHRILKNDCLIFIWSFSTLRSMSRVIIFVVGMVWASLLLLSWGGASETPNQPSISSALEQRAS
jgi:hypothetical protein